MPPAGQRRRPVGERVQDEVEKAARRREPLLEEDPAQERGEEGLDGAARDTRPPEGVGGGGLVAAPAEELQHRGAVTHADEPAGKRAEAPHRGVARVGEAAEAPLRADDRASLEQPEVEPVEIEHRPRLAVGRGQHLEAVVEQEPVDGVGPDAAADRVRALEDERLPAGRDERAGAGETCHPRADDDDVVFCVHVREGIATGSAGERAREARVDVGLPEREPGGLEPRRRHALTARAASPRPSARTPPSRPPRAAGRSPAGAGRGRGP